MKEKKIVLVKIRTGTNLVTPPLGIGYLLEALKGVPGIKAEFIDEQRDGIDEKRLLDMVRDRRPSMLGFQVFSVDYPRVKKLLRGIRKASPGTILIAGGPHVSALPELVLTENPELDFVIRGEGEEPIRALAEEIAAGGFSRGDSRGSIPGLSFRTERGVISNPVIASDIDKYEMPAWDLLEPDRYPAIQHGTFHRGRRIAPIMTSRGCPYPCTFCAGHLSTGKEVRKRRTDKVVNEIEYLRSRYGIDEYIIEDENFTYYKEHVIDIANEIRRRNISCHFSLPNGIRIDKIDDEIASRLRGMGVYMAVAGIESGSVRILKAIKKNWDLNMVRRNISVLKKSGIITMGSFIIGFPEETFEDIKETVKFAMTCGIDAVSFGNYIPLPGSEGFNRLVEDGKLRAEDIEWGLYTSYFGKIPFAPPGITKAELIGIIKKATLRFYLRPRILFGMLKRMTRPVFIKSLIFRVTHLMAGGGK